LIVITIGILRGGHIGLECRCVSLPVARIIRVIFIIIVIVIVGVVELVVRRAEGESSVVRDKDVTRRIRLLGLFGSLFFLRLLDLLGCFCLLRFWGFRLVPGWRHGRRGKIPLWDSWVKSTIRFNRGDHLLFFGRVVGVDGSI
jgi:hypothetical protein